jgi:saccharopine dehydrogenase-like NADP-dependent oxidoreductase
MNSIDNIFSIETRLDGTTAMAKTVGVPCGIATQLVLDGVLNQRGVIAPMSMDICRPLIDALEKEGIKMHEEILD